MKMFDAIECGKSSCDLRSEKKERKKTTFFSTSFMPSSIYVYERIFNMEQNINGFSTKAQNE